MCCTVLKQPDALAEEVAENFGEKSLILAVRDWKQMLY